MFDYQVIARKFRPQRFKDVVGQEAILQTLKNAIKFNRLGQAYLFSGPRGTGKTTLARLLAKALNCSALVEGEPCNQCASCQEIGASGSLDVIEIDGASHRGIEDIRKIKETVGYRASSGGYKIYIIDEVHMLTKEAFNALLKTLEEPPSHVKFLFATTEPHKVLPTILSRCQHFHLHRIPLPQMVAKLRRITSDLGVEAETQALHLIARRAEGGLRDAESLLDQLLAFEEGPLSVQTVTSHLGLTSSDIYFEMDRAGKEGRFVKAFEIAQLLFDQGKDLSYFIEGLIDHLRQILVIKLAERDSPLLTLMEEEKEAYEKTAQYYSQEQALSLIQYLLEAQNQLKLSVFTRFSLEAILLHIMRSHFRLSIDQLVARLCELEQGIHEKSTLPSPLQTSQKVSPPLLAKAPALVQSMSEDPTPSFADLGKESKVARLPESPISMKQDQLKHPLHRYDTLFQFAAIELEGRLRKT